MCVECTRKKSDGTRKLRNAEFGLRIGRHGTETEKQFVLRVASWDLQKSERAFRRSFVSNRHSSNRRFVVSIYETVIGHAKVLSSRSVESLQLLAFLQVPRRSCRKDLLPYLSLFPLLSIRNLKSTIRNGKSPSGGVIGVEFFAGGDAPVGGVSEKVA